MMESDNGSSSSSSFSSSSLIKPFPLLLPSSLLPPPSAILPPSLLTLSGKKPYTLPKKYYIPFNKKSHASSFFIMSACTYTIAGIVLMVMSGVWKNSTPSPYGGLWSLLMVGGVVVFLLGGLNFILLFFPDKDRLRAVFILLSFLLVQSIFMLAIVVLFFQNYQGKYVEAMMKLGFFDYSDEYHLVPFFHRTLSKGRVSGLTFSLVFFLMCLFTAACAVIVSCTHFKAEKEYWCMVFLFLYVFLYIANAISVYVCVHSLTTRISFSPFEETLSSQLFQFALIPSLIVLAVLLVTMGCLLHMWAKGVIKQHFFWIAYIILYMLLTGLALVGLALCIAFQSRRPRVVVNSCLTHSLLIEEEEEKKGEINKNKNKKEDEGKEEEEDNYDNGSGSGYGGNADEYPEGYFPLVRCIDSEIEKRDVLASSSSSPSPSSHSPFSVITTSHVSPFFSLSVTPRLFLPPPSLHATFPSFPSPSSSPFPSSHSLSRTSSPSLFVLPLDCGRVGLSAWLYSNTTALIDPSLFTPCYDFSPQVEAWAAEAFGRAYDLHTAAFWLIIVPLLPFTLLPLLYFCLLEALSPFVVCCCCCGSNRGVCRVGFARMFGRVLEVMPCCAYSEWDD